MRGKRRILLLLILALLAGCAAPASAPTPAATPTHTAEPTPEPSAADSGPLQIVLASDLHYLSPAINDNGPLFQAVTAANDGKLMLYAEEILEAFVEEMIERRPDCVILSGDLSYNGEYQSLADLAEKLRRLEAAGITVLAMPGNHDILSPYSFSFSGEQYEKVKNVNANEFRALFERFGYGEALSVDENSHSYVYELAGGLRVLMLDTNSTLRNCLPEKSLPWLEQQLLRAQEDGERVIAVSHQNLLLHNDLFQTGYRISNASELTRLYAKYGVLANFSGHMHIQHALLEPVPEVLTSPLSLTPCRYGWLIFAGDRLSYEAKSLSVEAWAARHGAADPVLLGFSAYAEEDFYQHGYRQVAEAYAGSALEEESIRRMADAFGRTNLAFFTGQAVDKTALSEDLAFWVEQDGESFSTVYLKSILTDEAPSSLSLTLWTAP